MFTMMYTIILMTCMLLIINHINVAIMMLIVIEMLGFIILMMTIMKMSIFMMFFSLIVQVCESILLMMLLFINITKWDNIKSWSNF